MISVINDNGWLVDLKAMTCKNLINGILVGFSFSGEGLVGELKNIPLTILEKMARMELGEWHVMKQQAEAEIVFSNAYKLAKMNREAF